MSATPEMMTDIVKRIMRLYAHGTLGGNMHIVLDDGNIEDHYIEKSIRFAREENDGECIELGLLLLQADMPQRAFLSDIIWSWLDIDHDML